MVDRPLSSQFSMLKKQLGFGRDAPQPKAGAATVAGAAEHAQQFLARHREMVRVAVKGTLQEHGMGVTWVGSDVGFGGDPKRLDALAIRLVVQEWREELLRYLPALQAAVLRGAVRIDPSFDPSRHRVTWEFAPDCGCPVSELPVPASWSAKAAVRAGPGSRVTAQAHGISAGATGASPKFDLPPSSLDYVSQDMDDIPSTFATSQSGFVDSQPAFQNTQPGQPSRRNKHRPPPKPRTGA